MVCYKDCILLYGGFGAKMYNDIHEIGVKSRKWKKIEVKGNKYDFPDKTYGHIMTLFKNYLVVHGGAGEYIEKLKSNETKYSIRFYDILTKRWENDREYNKTFMPSKRYYHAGDIYGGVLFLQGGFCDKNILDDMFLYDMASHEWVSLNLV